MGELEGQSNTESLMGMTFSMYFFFILRFFSLISENKAVGVMKAGHVFTIEPMICEGEDLGYHSWIGFYFIFL